MIRLRHSIEIFPRQLSEAVLVLVFFLVVGLTGVRTQGFELLREVLYYLSHTFSPLCSGYFGDRFL
jgi:hypothetical protein